MASNEIRVLLVEDSAEDARLVNSFLARSRRTRFSVVRADRLSGALGSLGRSEFDLVLTDLGLPDSKGLDTLGQLHEQAPRLPIVVLTGNDDEDTGVAAVRQGAQDYLVKGRFTPELLVRAARYAVERQRAEAERAALVSRLRDAETSLHTLSGLLPMCSACKKIRDDEGYWREVEDYVQAHSQAEFSHGICPQCRDQLYPRSPGSGEE